MLFALKVVGSIFLILLAFVLIVLFLILFAPIKVKLSYNKRFQFMLRWLFVEFIFDNRPILKLLGFKFSFAESDQQEHQYEERKEKKDKKKGFIGKRVEAFKDSVKESMQTTISDAKTLFTSPDERAYIKEIAAVFFRDLGAILKSLQAQFKLEGLVGFKSPADTGYLCGVLGILTGLGADIHVKGDFEREIFDLTFSFSARIFLYYVLFVVIRFLLFFYKMIKRREKE